jgi:hypothetical protein
VTPTARPTSVPSPVDTDEPNLGALINGNGGLSSSQADALAAALGGGLTAADVQGMTVGEILRAARARGLTPADVAALLNP